MSLRGYIRKAVKQSMETNAVVKDGLIDQEALVDVIVETIHKSTTSPEYIEFISIVLEGQRNR
jgi:hypothetical protein